MPTLKNQLAKLVLFISFMFTSVLLMAQIKYLQLTPDEAAGLAMKEKKIVMAIIESESCTQCNEMADKGLSGRVVKKMVDQEFIPVKYKKLPNEIIGANMVITFPLNFFGIIFFDGDKNILFANNSSTTSNAVYEYYFQESLNEKNDSIYNLPFLKKRYYTSLNNNGFIRDLLKKIRALALEPAQSVLDDLTQKAPADSLLSTSFIKTVLDGAPIYGSAALAAISNNNDNYYVAWYQFPLADRTSINNRIKAKSLQKAIVEKNLNYVYTIANNVQGSIQKSGITQTQERNYKSIFLQYYKGVNDTLNYIKNAVTYYDDYFMQIKVDLILKSDSSYRAKDTNQFSKPLPSDSGEQKNRTMTRTTITYSGGSAQYYGNELNNAAWALYTYTSDFITLKKALEWSKRSNEFYESPESMDTYARLLYKTGNKGEAIEWETKAVALKKIRSELYEDYETVLKKMKKYEPKID